ncbi:hypothetical protein LCGC14_0371400 [marine sediment metagenome]|uniref:Uncharacterized protein n=1 Tax=marine sediment metagenome TaxID=412755 RepID=A0A0F9WDJ9_9ZZZZ
MVILGGDENERGNPDEGIRVMDSDVETGEGSDAYGNIIYERQDGIIRAWTSSRPDRKKLRDDLVYIIENSGENVLITGWGVINFLDYHAFEIRLRRCEA